MHAATYGSVAVFIDWDNFAIGLREEMPERPPDLGPILRWVRQLGPVAVCRAYGEWRDPTERLAVYSAGVEVVYAPVLPLASAPARSNGGKSLADTEMAVDCVDFLHLIPEIATLVIVSSDKDLIPILRFAQRRGLHVYVVGSDRTAGALRDQSDDYVTYRTLLEQEGEAVTTPPVRPMEVPPGRFARAPRLTPARSMLATPTAQSSAPDADTGGNTGNTGPSRATLRRRRGRRRRGLSSAAPAAAAPAAAAAAAAPAAAASSEPDPAMVAPPPDTTDTPAPEAPEPPSTAAPAAAAAVADAPSEPEPAAAAAEASQPALKVLPGESLSRLKQSGTATEPPPETPAEDSAAAAEESAPAPAKERTEAPTEPAAVELVAPPAADDAPASSNGTTAEGSDPAAAQSDGTAKAPPAAEKKPKPPTRRRSTRRRSGTRSKTSTAKSKTAKRAKTTKAAAGKAESTPAADA